MTTQQQSSVDEFFAWCEDVLLSFISRLGPFGVALMPAIFTAFSVYSSLKSVTGFLVAFVFAAIVAAGIESAGIYLGHNAVKLNNVAGWILAALYLVAVCGIVLVGHVSFSSLALGIGLFSPVLVLAVYISHAMTLTKQTTEAKTETLEGEERRRQQAIEDEERALKLDLKRQREEAKIAARYGTPVQNGAQQSTQQNTQNGAQWQYPIDQARAQRIAQVRDQSVQRRAEIVRLLDDGVYKVTHLADYLGVHRNTITADLKVLEEKDVVHKNGHWGVKR
ncbi:ArsR family transcriptional regulator [Chloroflexota bacterium]